MLEPEPPIALSGEAPLGVSLAPRCVRVERFSVIVMTSDCGFRKSLICKSKVVTLVGIFGIRLADPLALFVVHAGGRITSALLAFRKGQAMDEEGRGMSRAVVVVRPS